MDFLVAKGIEQFDIEKLEENFNLSRCEACGAGAILSLMRSASILNKKKTVLLHRSDSADTSGDYSR
jgi:AmmeMemoRadiSam system protein B